MSGRTADYSRSHASRWWRVHTSRHGSSPHMAAFIDGVTPNGSAASTDAPCLNSWLSASTSPASAAWISLSPRACSRPRPPVSGRARQCLQGGGCGRAWVCLLRSEWVVELRDILAAVEEVGRAPAVRGEPGPALLQALSLRHLRQLLRHTVRPAVSTVPRSPPDSCRF